MGEIMVENLYRNTDGNILIFDTILLDKVTSEPNIQLLLNMSVFEVTKDGPDRIASACGICSQNSTLYDVSAPLFVDASGDGVIGFCRGSFFRMGAESPDEFGEQFAPEKEYGSLLGHSINFYSKDVGRSVRAMFLPALQSKDITKIPRYRRFNAQHSGCRTCGGWNMVGGLTRSKIQN